MDSPIILIIVVIPLFLQWLFMLYVWKRAILSSKEKILWIFILATFPIISIPGYFIYRAYTNLDSKG